jgi:hypothetical protein
MPNNYNKYKNGLTRDEIELFELLAGSILTEYGYQLENHVPDQDLIFSSEDIRQFDLENQRLKEKFIRMASPLDIVKREAQNKFLLKLFERKSISIPL